MLKNQKQKIAIMGAGEIGTALEFVLSKNNILPYLWDINPKKCKNNIGKNIKELKILYSVKQIILENKDAQNTIFEIFKNN